MSVDVNEHVDLNQLNLLNFKKIPFKFKNVNGDFVCNKSKLNSLEGSPDKVNGRFNCNSNLLTSLKYSPNEVGEYFDCSFNNLTSLEGLPKFIGGSIYCERNNIRSFKGVPEDYNGLIFCAGNPVFEVYKLFNNNTRCAYWLNEYDVIQGNNIIMNRLEEVFHQLDIGILTEIDVIQGYNII